MNTQDRAVVKSLLQYMTDRYLTGSDEFRATLKHFNITTTSCHSHEGFTKTKHVVIVFAADRIDLTPHGFHVEFASKEAAEAYEAKMRAIGDEPVNTSVLNARDTHAKTLAMNIETAHAEALQWNDFLDSFDGYIKEECMIDFVHAEALEIDAEINALAAIKEIFDADHADALEMNQSRSETIRAIIAQAIHVGANSWGGVIGEHEELVETLRNAGFPAAAEKVDAVYGWCVGHNHKDFRTNWLAALRATSASL